MKIAVIPNLTREKAAPITRSLLTALAALGVKTLLSEQYRGVFPEANGAFLPEAALFAEADIIMPVGGDGSVIRAGKRAAVNGKRILGVNAGNLAYLCGLDPTEFGLLPRLLSGEFTIQRRMLLQADIYKGEALASTELCLNDIVFCRGQKIGLVDLSVQADEKPIADYIADGVIFATPTGSTAYSFSAGGPVIEPDMKCILLTPICPHALTSRQVVFTEDAVLSAHVLPESTLKCYMTVDGQNHIPISSDDIITVRKAPKALQLIILKEKNFYTLLNEKLKEF